MPELVPTTYDVAFRDTGRYQSTSTLPDLDLVLDRALKQIATSYEFRGRSKKSFDALWRKVCKKLLQLRNATAYAHWKFHQDTVRNRRELDAAQVALSESWFSVEGSVPNQHGTMHAYFRHADNFEELQDRRASLKPKIRATTDDALEVAIAYWIEAKNACNAADHLRTLHSLIECHFYIGITFAPKTESEAKSEAGRKQGQELRDMMATHAIQAMREMKIDKRMQDQDHLIGTVAQILELKFAGDFADYEAQATAGRDAIHSPGDRFTETLRKWANEKASPYPEIADEVRRIKFQASSLKASSTQKRRRQPDN